MAEWASEDGLASLEDPGLGYPAALDAVRIEGSLEGLGPPLVVQLESESSIAAGRVPWGLGPHINGTDLVRVSADRTSPEALRKRAGRRSIVFVGRNVHRLAGAAELVQAVAATHTVVVVEMGWPSSWRPANVRAFVTTYGASLANGRAAAEKLGLARV
jgi:beta-N-acetylhexosaminidase